MSTLFMSMFYERSDHRVPGAGESLTAREGVMSMLTNWATKITSHGTRQRPRAASRLLPASGSVRIGILLRQMWGAANGPALWTRFVAGAAFLAIAGLAFSAVSVAGGTGNQAGESSPLQVTGSQPKAQETAGPYAEPERHLDAGRSGPGGLGNAGAALSGTAGLGSETMSPAMARALARVRDAVAPQDEVFAIIKVTDRRNGTRRVLTRGQADPDLGRYLDRPETAPAGHSYVDVETLEADEDAEIAIRSVRLRHASPFDGALTREEERESDLLHGSGRAAWLGPRIKEGLRAQIERGAVDLAGDARQGLTPVMVSPRNVPRLTLPKAHDPETGGLLWTSLETAAARERAIIDRKREMADLQAPLIRAIEERGGMVEYASWMSGLIQTRLPGAAIQVLAEHPSVSSLEYIPPAVTHSHFYEGDDVFITTNAQDFDLNHQGLHGDVAKHSSTGRVYVAMGEQCVDPTSPAWRDHSSPSASRAVFYNCDPANCSLGGIVTCWDDVQVGSQWPPHGHYVAAVMAGDLMDGQVGSLTATERRRLTGTCPECKLLFMQDQGLDDRPKVHDLACEKGVDIFEESLGWTSGSLCDGEGFMDDSVEGLVDCDAVYVSSAGNTGNPACDLDCCDGSSYSSCSTMYPADHPWTFAVSGIQTQDPCDTPGEYYTGVCAFDNCSSRGGGAYDGYAGSASLVDLAAPWRVGMGANPGTVDGDGVGLVGTSFSAPLVAGLMGEMMDWYQIHLSHSIFHNNRMRAFMLLFGDRSSGFSGTSQNLGGLDRYWGAGRVGLVPFDQLAAWNVYRYQVTLGKNDSYTVDLNVLPGGGLFKAALTHDGKNYEDEPRIDLTLDPLGCPAGTMQWNEYDSKSLLTHPWLAGCSQVRVTIKNTGIGSSGTRTLHFFAYQTPQTNERTF